MTSELRNGLFQILFRKEDTFGVANTNVYPGGFYLGLHSALELPDPQYNWNPLYGIAKNARAGNARSWALQTEGKQEFSGSFNNMLMITGHILPFILGTESLVYNNPYYTHDIREAEEIPSFTLDGRFYNVDYSQPSLIRRWAGCKIDTATLFCDQRGYLNFSINKLYAKNLTHNVGAVAETDSARAYLKYDSSLIDSGPIEYPFSNERDPYLFSEGSISILDGFVLNTPENLVTLSNISKFSLTIENNIKAKYYETTSTTDEIQTPYEFLEGKREYTLDIVADVAEVDYLYKLLLIQGRYGGAKRGIGININFAKRPGILTNNILEIRIPGDDSTHSWDDNNTTLEASHPGAFSVRGAHNVNIEEKRVTVNLRLTVPSVSFLVKDRFDLYTAVS